MQVYSPLKNWKHAHHSRRPSSENSDCLDSQDSNSVKFSKFNTKKSEKGMHLSDRKYASPQPIFVFTGKSRQKYAEKVQGKQTEQGEFNTSKFSEGDLFLHTLVSGQQPLSTPTHITHSQKKTPSLTQRYTSKSNSPICFKLMLSSVKALTLEFRKIIDSFSKKYSQLKKEWDRSFSSLLSLQVSAQSKAILQLRQQLQRKQCQLEQITRISLYKNSINQVDAAKFIELQRGTSELEGPLANLAISKIESISEKDVMLNLTRNITIHELLQHYHNSQPTNKTKEAVPLPASSRMASSPPLLPQVRSMRQTITRMWQILQQ